MSCIMRLYALNHRLITAQRHVRILIALDASWSCNLFWFISIDRYSGLKQEIRPHVKGHTFTY